MGYKISKKALTDIDEIWNHSAENWSIEQADRYYHLIFEEIEFIAENPLTSKDYSYIRKNYRCTIVKSHLIFYRINNKKNEVEIIRVLHQRMDVEDRMK
jgi:toxin ParE1/3/4